MKINHAAFFLTQLLVFMVLFLLFGSKFDQQKLEEDIYKVTETQSSNLVRANSLNKKASMAKQQEIDDRGEYKKNYRGLLQKLRDSQHEYCGDMYEGKFDIPWNEEQKAIMEKHEIALMETIKGKAFEGNSGNYKDQLRMFYDIMQHGFMKTVCETGFNAGHSSLMWLNSNPQVHVYSFDLGSHFYSRPLANTLQEIFPGRLNVTYGDSRKTLRTFREAHPDIKCDLVYIDGGHSSDVPIKDFYNFYQMVKPSSDHLLIIDDWPSDYVSIAAMWINVTTSDKIEYIKQCKSTGKQRGITISLFKF